MADMKVDIKVRDAVEAARGRFEFLATTAFPRAVQYSLNRVVIDGVNRFRKDMPIVLRHSNDFTRKSVRYDLDRRQLSRVTSVDDVKAAAFILPQQSVWLKYAFGEERRPGGDVGIEAFFPNHTQIYLPNVAGLATQGIGPNASGNFKASDMRMLGKILVDGYQRNTQYAGKWGLFEIKVGARDPARLGVGVHARPPRALAMQSRERLKRKVRNGKAQVPMTTFNRRDGMPVTVPRVVNEDVPRLLFRTQPDGHVPPDADAILGDVTQQVRGVDGRLPADRIGQRHGAQGQDALSPSVIPDGVPMPAMPVSGSS